MGKKNRNNDKSQNQRPQGQREISEENLGRVSGGVRGPSEQQGSRGQKGQSEQQQGSRGQKGQWERQEQERGNRNQPGNPQRGPQENQR